MVYYEPRPWHYLIPMLIFIGGTFTARLGGIWWIACGVLIDITGLACLVFITVIGILRERSRGTDSRTSLYDSMRRLSDEDKAALGLTDLPNHVQVEVKKDDVNDGYYSRQYEQISISPVKLRTLAKALTDGTPFSRRKIAAGSSKVLTETEFYRVRDEMIQLNFLATDNAKDVNAPTYLTPLGKRAMRRALGLDTTPLPHQTLDLAENAA